MNRPKEWFEILAVGLVAGIVAGCFSVARWPVPSIHDEFSHLLVADTLMQGRLSNPSPPVWPAFQAEHIVVTPRYASKYPVGPGALLALGRMTFGVPQAGLWLGAMLASAAVVWMVRSFTSLKVAIWAGLMVAFHPFLQSVWSQNFMNGWLAMASASLVVGAAIRLRRSWNGPDSAVLACGAVGLAVTRPMEGLICLCFAALLFLPRAIGVASQWWRGFSFTQCSWFLIPGLAGAGLLLAHHHSVTGRFMQMPYQLHEQQYGVAPLWIFQKPKTPTWLAQGHSSPTTQPSREHFEDGVEVTLSQLVDKSAKPIANGTITPEQVPEEIRRFHTGWSMDSYRDQTSVSGWLSGCWERFRSGFEYFGAITVLAVLGVFQIGKWTKVRLVSLAVFGLFGVSTFVPWVFPHYYAPLVPWLIILSVIGIRYAPNLFSGAENNSRQIKKQFMICLLGLQICLVSVKAWGIFTHPEQTWAHQRSAIERALEESGGKHLVLVRYSPSHNVHDEWVYNSADLDSAPVVWARSWRADYDEQLKQHYAGSRQIWVVQPDEVKGAQLLPLF
jgi:hypothetical protein